MVRARKASTNPKSVVSSVINRPHTLGGGGQQPIDFWEDRGYPTNTLVIHEDVLYKAIRDTAKADIPTRADVLMANYDPAKFAQLGRYHIEDGDNVLASSSILFDTNFAKDDIIVGVNDITFNGLGYTWNMGSVSRVFVYTGMPHLNGTVTCSDGSTRQVYSGWLELIELKGLVDAVAHAGDEGECSDFESDLSVSLPASFAFPVMETAWEQLGFMPIISSVGDPQNGHSIIYDSTVKDWKFG